MAVGSTHVDYLPKWSSGLGRALPGDTLESPGKLPGAPRLWPFLTRTSSHRAFTTGEFFNWITAVFTSFQTAVTVTNCNDYNENLTVTFAPECANWPNFMCIENLVKFRNLLHPEGTCNHCNANESCHDHSDQLRHHIMVTIKKPNCRFRQWKIHCSVY